MRFVEEIHAVTSCQPIEIFEQKEAKRTPSEKINCYIINWASMFCISECQFQSKGKNKKKTFDTTLNH